MSEADEPYRWQEAFTLLPVPLRNLNAIRTLREQKSPPWSQADLAVRVGTTQSRISAYELGKMSRLSLRMAFDIANALGAHVERVFYGLFEESCERHGGRVQGLNTIESSEHTP